MTYPLIKTKKLKKYYSTADGDLHAVDGIDLTINKGKTLGVVGESGCGKTTLGRVILRLIEATSGEVLFDGDNILKYNAKQMKNMRKNMQIIFQDPYASLNPRRTVGEIISEPLIVYKLYINKKEREEKVKELMELVGLSERLINVYPHELDGGRRQRIGIARALSLNPQFIVCDEPVSALDVSIQAQILNLLMDLQDEMGLTYMFISHDLSVIKHISDEIMVMYLGQCVEKTTSNELFQNPLHPYTKALLEAILIPSLECRKKRREIIEGEVASPINLKPACRFAQRCKYVKAECTTNDIELVEVSEGHSVRCILYN